MSSGNTTPLSLRPSPVADTKPKSIADFIARVNAQPGGFRALDEDKLREKIRTSEVDGDATHQDVDMSEGDQDEDDEPATKDPSVARMEVLRNIDIAGNTALLTLDSISLLLSKLNPTQASATLSQQLRDMVGIGTVGVDKLDDSNVTPAKSKEQRDIAVGWTLMEINKTRDAAEEASSLLRSEVEAEEKYWEDVLKVHKAGWSLTKVPQERHTLGVRFGFSEAAPEFRNNGLAPLRRGDDGSIQLDCGRLGGVSERILVTYEKGGKMVGRSPLPALTPDDAPLEARILEARNTIFAQELWYELSREARSLISYDVRPLGSRLTCDIDSTSKIILELVPLSSSPSADDDLPENAIARTISTSLHLLLSHAHQNNELWRTRPMPPHITRSRGQQTYPLLRPIIARMMHTRSVQACSRYTSRLIQTLKKAGLPASFVIQTPPSFLFDSGSHGPNQPSPSQTLIRNMLQPLEFTIETTILSDTTFTIRGRTFLFPITTTHYHVLAPAGSPLQTICAPYKDGYPDLRSLCDYLRTATARILTEDFLAKLTAAPYKKSEWVRSIRGTSIRSIRGTSIRDLDREEFEVRFFVDEDSATPDTTDAFDAGKIPVLGVTGTAWADAKLDTRTFAWRDGNADSETQSLHDVVNQLFDQALA